jgi:hypothetical protein
MRQTHRRINGRAKRGGGIEAPVMAEMSIDPLLQEACVRLGCRAIIA